VLRSDLHLDICPLPGAVEQVFSCQVLLVIHTEFLPRTPIGIIVSDGLRSVIRMGLQSAKHMTWRRG